MIQVHNLMNFGSLFIALKSLYTRPFYALEKPYKIPDISVTKQYLYEARN